MNKRLKRKVGFIGKIKHVQEMERQCDEVYIRKRHSTVQELLSFVEKYSQDILVFHSLEDIGLQLGQLLPVLELVTNRQIPIIFIWKTGLEELSDGWYLSGLLAIAKHEKEIVRRRALNGLEKAKKEGKEIGRPRINEKTIADIRYQYNHQGKSIREVSDYCHVSIGTVHKYLRNE